MSISMLYGHLNEFDISKFYHQVDVISNPDEILSFIDKIIRNRKEISDDLLNARVFINNGTRDDFGFCVSNNSPYVNETLYKWLARITNASSFCAVINGVNGWSDELALKINKDFNIDWVNKFGVPSHGIDVYVFMGKYNITPFGIHKDREHTFLYHLGPGIKKAWVWDPEYMDISQFVKSDSFNLKETLSWAHEIILHPGDSLFIPQNWYHVLENPEFSVTLGIAPYEKPRTELISSFLMDVLGDNKNEEFSQAVSFPKVWDVSTKLNTIVPVELKRLNLEDIEKKGITRLLNRLESNHYFKYTSPTRKVRQASYRYFGGVIVGEDDGKETRVYLRGHEFIIKSDFKELFVKLQEIIKEKEFIHTTNSDDTNTLLRTLMIKLIQSGAVI